MHYIKRYILDNLVHAKYLRNRDMRPKNVESNLYQYHLKELVKDGYVSKDSQGYTLATQGLRYADTHSDVLKKTRPQPKLVTVVVLRRSDGRVLLLPRAKQPFIGAYHLPSGKVHENESTIDAAERELIEKVSLQLLPSLTYRATAHVTIIGSDDEPVSEYYACVFEAKLPDSYQLHSGQELYLPGVGISYEMMPGIDTLLDHLSLGNQFFEITERC